MIATRLRYATYDKRASITCFSVWYETTDLVITVYYLLNTFQHLNSFQLYNEYVYLPKYIFTKYYVALA